jgi:hypothetical protein
MAGTSKTRKGVDDLVKSLDQVGSEARARYPEQAERLAAIDAHLATVRMHVEELHPQHVNAVDHAARQRDDARAAADEALRARGINLDDGSDVDPGDNGQGS